YRSSIADNNSFEQWEAEGAQDAYRRANTLYKKMLADYQAPALDPALDEALQAFIRQRKDAMPDAFS
ncbi:MAG TPA: trimethylamine methyltransferase, partial [Kiloniellaceae bacterium]|nr:trimethylamine methyltransferase [Kiloniellaceae bacterium]